MTVHWFFAPPEDWRDAEVALPADESHHALKVLRVSPPDVVTITDGRGLVARCAAARVEGERLVAEVLERKRHRRLSPELVVYQGAAKHAKIDGIVERLAEVGVAEFYVYDSSRSIVKWDDDKLSRRDARWRTIARSSATLARSPFVMSVAGALSFDELAARVEKESLPLVLWEEASLPMRTAFVEPADRVALVVGPEGGLEPEEAEALADAGAQLVSLGPRILRTENAAMVAVAALLFHYGLVG
jgi:16S rRNA (uracil1498-N3)-methyltransferase